MALQIRPFWARCLRLWDVGAGFLLVIRRWGVRGAAVAECVCAGLAIRDASMVASGVPGRLRSFPASLLRRSNIPALAAQPASVRAAWPAPAVRSAVSSRATPR